mgnify:CR=1 FL=1
MAEMLTHLTRIQLMYDLGVSLDPIKGSTCFHEQETLVILLRIGLFQERIRM